MRGVDILKPGDKLAIVCEVVRPLEGVEIVDGHQYLNYRRELFLAKSGGANLFVISTHNKQHIANAKLCAELLLE